MSKNLCPNSKSCPVFAGKVDTGTIPLALYRNVFCYRGVNGWGNCKSYTTNQKDLKEVNDRKEKLKTIDNPGG
nr:hypothetical protein [uncultured Carboxylicivirga sp.]